MDDFAYLHIRYDDPIDIGASETQTWRRHLLSKKGLPMYPGKRLPNGATLLLEHELRCFDHRRDSLVLCTTTSEFTPFASWVRVLTTDSPVATGGYQVMDTCAWGDYYSDLENAIVQFQARLRNKEELLRFSE